MKYQKRYKPKTKFEKFLKVYFMIGILVIVFTGIYAYVKTIQRKNETASETIIHTISVSKISLKKTEWVGKKRFVDCEFEPIKGAKRYYIAISSNRNFTGCTEISGEPNDNTKNIVFRIEQNKWKSGQTEYVRIRAQLSGNKRYTDWSEVLAIKADEEMAANNKAHIDSLATGPILLVLSSGAVTGLILIGLFGGAICFTLYDKYIEKKGKVNHEQKENH